jgi:hypothetical protein
VALLTAAALSACAVDEPSGTTAPSTPASSTTVTTSTTEPSTTSTSVLSDWVSPAVDYLEGWRGAINAHDPIGAAAFYDAEWSAWSDGPGQGWGYGRFGIESFLRVRYTDEEAAIAEGPVFLAPQGAVVIGEFSCTDCLGSGRPAAAVMWIGPGGIVYQLNAYPLDVLESAFSEWVTPIQEPNTRAGFEDAEGMYEAWMEASNTHDPQRVLDLFVEDSQGPASLAVVSVIEAYPGLRVEPQSLEAVVPGWGGDPALFSGASPGDRSEIPAVGVYTLDLDGCPMLTATVWFLERGRVLDVATYFEVESLRRCGVPATFGSSVEGWWSEVGIPETSPLVETGTVGTSSGHEVLIFNGTERLEALVKWALDRYQRAGMGEPAPLSVAFPPSARCRGVVGLALDTGSGLEIQMCFGEDELCTDDADCTEPARIARLNMLHEMAHVWLTENLDEETRQAFLELRGLEQWTHRDLDWVERGVEHAAEIIAWGLMDESVPVPRLPDLNCDTLAEGFRLLTGVDPLVDLGQCSVGLEDP